MSTAILARVVGVLPKDFQFPTLESADIVSPFAFNRAVQQTVNGGFGDPMRLFARLKPGVSVAQAYAQMQPLFQRRSQLVSRFGEEGTSAQYPNATRPRDPGRAPGCVDSLRVCSRGLADCVRQRGRLDDGARSRATTGACCTLGDRREPWPARPASTH